MFYLEHEEEVRYVDGLLAHSQEWQWLVSIIEAKTEFKNITSWKEFIVEKGQLQRIYGYFLKILGVCNTEWKWSRQELQQLWMIAKFYLGIVNVEECISNITDMFCELFFFCVWITKLENIDNQSDYLMDIRLLCQRNCYEIIRCNSLQIEENNLLRYAREHFPEKMGVPLDCLRDNIEQKEYLSDETFLKKYETEILDYNCFDHKSLPMDDCITWQEEGLLDLLRISFQDRKVIPAFSGNGRSVPDITSWTEESLLSIKEYFNNDSSDFLVESVLYMMFQKEPSTKVKLMHCKLLKQAMQTEEDSFCISNSSSYKILSCLHIDRLMKDCNGAAEYVAFIKLIQEETDPDVILEYSEVGFPLGKEQRKKIFDFLTNKYKEIDDIKDIYQLNSYLGDEYTTKQITTEYLKMVDEKFAKMIAEQNDFMISTIFWRYMLFLLHVNKNSGNVDKRYVQSTMIKLQQLWQDSVYEKQCENMHTFSQETEIKREVIEQFSEQSLSNPIIFAHYCIPCTEEKILEIMICASRYPLQLLCSKIIITPVFPEQSDGVRLERHDVDKMLLEYVDSIKERKGYKLLNPLDSEKYIESIHERYKTYTSATVSVFTKEKELYNQVKKETKEVKLENYRKTLPPGHLTQLFPVLEIRIRELVKLFGIFPFKKNEEEFMQYNDPSSLLRELLKQIYEEQHSFENIPDLLYVYNIMYNSNSFNIRNECVHGRDYLKGNSLRFAFRATLMAIAMVNFRIKTIQQNVSDIDDLIFQ